MSDGPARVLVVDDDRTSRMKMRMAVASLGHEAVEADGGKVALALLLADRIDAVLLDIVMPGMDGFAVLEQMKSDPALEDIPVIVVSALDDDTASVVHAIENGAEDFLPKSFDPVILRARLGAALSKKRNREREREYLNTVARVTRAAESVEAGHFAPEDLCIDDIARRDDTLGRFAAVFRGMAEEIYLREVRLRRRIEVLQGTLVVLLIGLIWGLMPSLSRMTIQLGAHPLSAGFWLNLSVGSVALVIALTRGSLPKLGVVEVRFFLVWALVSGVLQRLVTFNVIGNVEASILSLMVAFQGFIVFAFAVAIGLEQARARRIIGLLVGLAGVGLIFATRADGDQARDVIWLAIAMALPVLLALETLHVSKNRPQHVGLAWCFALMMLLSAAILLPFGLAAGSITIVGSQKSTFVLLVGGLAAASLSAGMLKANLQRKAGPVFASQSAYTVAIAGIVWGLLLLDESLTASTWLAIAAILLGLWLVDPRPSSAKVVIKRQFRPPQVAASPKRDAGHSV